MLAAVAAPATFFALSTRSYQNLRRTCPPLLLRQQLPFRRTSFSASAVETAAEAVDDDEAMSVDALHRFIELSLGKWSGIFAQFDEHGVMMQNVSTRLSVSSYGEGELRSLLQTLYIQQPPSETSISGHRSELEWAEYKIKETNILQWTNISSLQIGFFPNDKAFVLRYQTAGMLDFVLRAGVLGEDDTGEESPRNLKLPSRRPSIVCESCLYSQAEDMRVRAFHIMDPKGSLDTLLIFLERRGESETSKPSFFVEDGKDMIVPFVVRWEGHSVTKRSGVYGATIAEADIVAILEMDENGQLVQDITSSSAGGVITNVHWTGSISSNLINFDGGFQITLLPNGMYMGCPSNVGKSVSQSQSFHLEFCWMESPNKRQRLVRTHDVEGLAVSLTYFSETMVEK